MTSYGFFPNYTQSERRVDLAVHLLGLVWAFSAVPLLLFATNSLGDPAKLVSALLYSLGLLWMLGFSTAYNAVQSPGPKRILRRLDHSGIFVMIAGTYTPFALVKFQSTLGLGILAFIWCLAVIGVLLSLVLPKRVDKTTLTLCLVMGWSVVLVFPSLEAAVSTTVLVLLMVGGGLFTTGVAFYLAKGLRFHNAIWHLFVLAAVVCHWIAVFLALRSA